ncbi:multidrug resistance-associated protein 1-like [Ostrea edulis]|uniref:multidrug resistance-associated protein 1-like n=1 Tax=Ostrea edulis TaxID=37623 RepID=UPI0024AF34E6|nr:multidrug resistance-associated protein 1-like [Ostrea edulis]
MDFVGRIERFCSVGEKLWDINVTWNTATPDFTPCFQRTVLSWTPIAFLVLFSPLRYWYLADREPAKDQIRTKLSVSKYSLYLVLTLLSMYEALETVYIHTLEDVVWRAEFVTPLLVTTSLIFAIQIYEFERKRQVRSSGFLVIFWFLVTINQALIIQSNIRKRMSKGILQLDNTIVFLGTKFVLSAIQFLLVACFVEQLSLEDKPSRFPNANDHTFLSQLSFLWVTRLLKRGFSRPLTVDDMVELPAELASDKIMKKFETCWRTEAEILEKKSFPKDKNQKKKEVSLIKVLFRANLSQLLLFTVLRTSSHFMTFIGPLMFSSMMNFAEDKNDFLWHAILFASVNFTVICLESMMMNFIDTNNYIFKLKMQSSLMGALYRKMAKLSNESKKSSTVGEMVNLMSKDANRVIVFQIQFLFFGPLVILTAMYLLYQEMGMSTFVGFSFLLVLIPANAYIAKTHKEIDKKVTDFTDKRMKIMNEVFNGMKVLKLYAWETSFEEKIASIRRGELSEKKTKHIIDAISHLMHTVSDYLITFVIFAFYLWISDEHVLNTRKIFYTMSVFDTLRRFTLHLPTVITNTMEFSVALGRLQTFLNLEELDETAIERDPNADYPVDITNASFSWNRDKKIELSQISLKVADGELIAIVGSVAAGKSSLLTAIVGEMEKVSGSVKVKGTTAYVTQQAWIQNVTVKENILFGREFRDKFYNKVLDACALRADLEILVDGDETEIGEKGINLSGGQKQRVSLARAVYQDTDIYLLDDPLSAVDAHVGRHIFENVIGPKGLLRKKTRILVTHAISFLPYVDKIISLENGRISETGTYDELMEKRGPFSDFVKKHMLEDPKMESRTAALEKNNRVALKRQRSQVLSRQFSRQISLEQGVETEHEIKCQSTKFIKEELVETGQVKWSSYKTYLKAAGPLLILLMTLAILENILDHATKFWLSDWGSDSAANDVEVATLHNATQIHEQEQHRLKIYGFLGVIRTLLYTCEQMTAALIAITCSKKMHEMALASTLRAPLSFVENNPIGRIVNRFSADMDAVDGPLPWATKSFFDLIPFLIGVIITICVGLPVFLYCVIPLSIICFVVQRVFTASATQTRRIHSALSSPQYAHYSESINGVTTIRAFDKLEMFTNESDRRRDVNHRADLTAQICHRWMGISLRLLAATMLFWAYVLAALYRDHLSLGMIAIMINYTDMFTGSLLFLVWILTELDTKIVSVERIEEYISLEPEAEWRKKESEPDAKWPQYGEVVIKDFGLRYREDLALTLKGISCNIKAGERIGIVGRTGAGKSSLTLGLFRIIEKAQGTIHIDGIDISSIGLHDLRSKLTIIPQDPVLFSGSIRMNLDPFDIYTDDDLWEVLEHAHLRKFVESLEEGLQYECTEGGDNLSVGQRQLVCLARALLKKTKVLILDEATAAVDLETDNLIQQTIRREFSDCTILTIAHRLNTIMDYSRIMVLRDGQILEMDSPKALLKNENSSFYNMAKKANLV